jgi:hypothetical protein
MLVAALGVRERLYKSLILALFANAIECETRSREIQ